jgi:thymidylate synthase (FAD)
VSAANDMNDDTGIQVLDHGYVRFIESWGCDERVIEAARMSTNKGFQGWGSGEEGAAPGDEKLLRYLWENKHATPFEMAGMVIEVQAPIFVFREWHRHRTQSYSELSSRYTQMPNLHYVPSVERIMTGGQSASNKQGSSALSISQNEAEAIRTWIANEQSATYGEYERLLGLGLAKELARINTPVSRYSRMRASANLRNWLGFLTLRMAPNAQFEIREYANAVHRLAAHAFPRTVGLFDEDRTEY